MICPKCGNINTQHPRYQKLGSDEWLQIVCSRCGYVMKQDCKDKKEQTNDD